MNLNWLDRAEFSNTENDSTLKISHKANTILIRLDDTRRKVVLRIRGKEKYEFIVKPYRNNTFLVEAPSTITHKENAANSLFSGIQNIVPSFIIDLTSSVVAGSGDFQLLSQDKTFMRCLESTKEKFIIHYKMLVTKQ